MRLVYGLALTAGLVGMALLAGGLWYKGSAPGEAASGIRQPAAERPAAAPPRSCEAAPAAAQPPRDPVTAQHEPPAPESLPPVRVREGRVSAEIRGASRHWLVHTIAQASAIRVVGLDELPDETVSVSLHETPIDQALRELLSRQDAFFLHSGEGHPPGALSIVFVYPPGKGQELLPVPPELWASTAEAEQRAQSSDADERRAGLELVVRLRGERSLDTVMEALADPEESVRMRVLDLGLQRGVPVPATTLYTLVERDASPVVRLLALKELGRRYREPGDATAPDDPSVRLAAELALRDPDGNVRAEGHNLLLEMGVAGATQPRIP